MNKQNEIPNLYVISLPDHKKRLEGFKHTYTTNIGGKIIVFDGINGNDYVNKEKIKHNQTKNNRFGCFLAHQTLWKKLSTELGDSQWALVAEDDAVINRSFKVDWPMLKANIEASNGNILILSYNWKEGHLKHTTKSAEIFSERANFNGTHFYALNGKGAKELLNNKEMNPFKQHRPLDMALGKQTGSPQLFFAQSNNTPEMHVYAYTKDYGDGSITEQEDIQNTNTIIQKNNYNYLVPILILILIGIGIYTIYMYYLKKMKA